MRVRHGCMRNYVNPIALRLHFIKNGKVHFVNMLERLYTPGTKLKNSGL